MADRKELIRALKCSHKPGNGGCKKLECPYFIHTDKDDPDRQEFEKKHGETPEEFWDSCDFERMDADFIQFAEEQDAYRWHNIMENPEDLPDGEDDQYLVYDYLNEEYRVYRAWAINEKHGHVAAWRRIEPFEVRAYCTDEGEQHEHT